MEIEQTWVPLPAGTRQHRPGMGLVQPLVRRETHIAIDAENAVSRIADQRQLGFVQCGPNRGDQFAERPKHFGFVDRLARLEPGWIVVVAQFAEERERGRAEPGKPARGCRHCVSSSPLPPRRAESKESRFPFGPGTGVSTTPNQV